MPIGHGFSFLVMEQSWNINVEKEGAPCFEVTSIWRCINLIIIIISSISLSIAFVR